MEELGDGWGDRLGVSDALAEAETGLAARTELLLTLIEALREVEAVALHVMVALMLHE